MNAPFARTQIRRAVAEDVPVLASLNVQTWQETYRGLLPDSLLDAADFAAEREQTWHLVIKYAGLQDAVFLLSDAAGLPVGYASAGAARESNLGFPAELHTLYLLRRAQSRGWGRALWETVTAHLGHLPFYLWSHAQNPAVRFYEHMGGQAIATRRGRWGDVTYPEAAYGFPATR